MMTGMRALLDKFFKKNPSTGLISDRPDPFGGRGFEEHQRITAVDLLPAAGKIIDVSVPASQELQQVSDHVVIAPFFTVGVQLTEAASVTWGLTGNGIAVLAECDSVTGKVRLRLMRNAQNEILAESPLGEGQLSLILTITENIVVLWQGEMNNPKPIIRSTLSAEDQLDLRKQSLLNQLRVVSAGPIHQLQAGYFGYLGLRDPQFVRSGEGEIIHRSGRALLSMTCAGPGFFYLCALGSFQHRSRSPRRF